MWHPGQQHAKHQHAAQKILLNTPKRIQKEHLNTNIREIAQKKSNFEYQIRIEYYH